jgi:DnaK suppressor protein
MANAISSKNHTAGTDDELAVSYPEFTRILLLKKNDILTRCFDARKNLDQQVLDTPGDEADASTVDASADYFLKLTNTFQLELREIEAAFDRMNRQVYGQCESCEEAIGQARLHRVPEARLCIDCQARTERLQGVIHPRLRKI